MKEKYLGRDSKTMTRVKNPLCLLEVLVKPLRFFLLQFPDIEVE